MQLPRSYGRDFNCYRFILKKSGGNHGYKYDFQNCGRRYFGLSIEPGVKAQRTGRTCIFNKLGRTFACSILDCSLHIRVV